MARACKCSPSVGVLADPTDALRTKDTLVSVVGRSAVAIALETRWFDLPGDARGMTRNHGRQFGVGQKGGARHLTGKSRSTEADRCRY